MGKDTMGPLRESLTGPVDEADAAPGAAPAAAAPAPGGAGGGNKYVPPSRRGAGGMSDAQARVSGGDMMPDRRREDTAAIRVSNLSENAQETDLQELFKPFGGINRIFLAKAIATLNGFGYDHLILSVEWAKPSTDR